MQRARSSLYAFQLRLSERMQAACDGAKRLNKLRVMIGDRPCLLDVQEIAEIVVLQAMACVPLTHDWYAGLVNVRGNIVSVIDYARLTGEEVQQRSQHSRMVVSATVTSALLVSRVHGMVDMMQVSWTRQVCPSLPGAVALYKDDTGVSWLEISLARLMEVEQVLHAAR